jgi:hypothetical protein
MLISDFLNSKSATPAVFLERRTIARRQMEENNFNLDKTLDVRRAGSYEKY